MSSGGPGSLEVHLHGDRVGTLFPAGDDDYRFAYSPEAVKRSEPGTVLLSNSLPVRPEPYGAAASRAYVDGLLPEGPWRARLARELGIDPGDGFALLRELGRDCAGAVVFLPQEARAPAAPASVAWVSDEELEELVWQPPKRLIDPGAEQRMRFCLPGLRHKLALILDKRADRWGWPSPGSPSTHVVKPESGAFTDLVVNEMFCMTVARRAGLPVVEVELKRIAGRPCLVSRRFDRHGEWPNAARIHQEDMCQALGYPPAGEGTVADAEGPGFGESWGLLNAVERLEDVAPLLQAAVCNHVLGNGDAHGKNFSLLCDRDGQRLAPLHGLRSTVVYDAPIHTGMVLAEDYESEHANLLELAQASEECNFDFDRFRVLAGSTAERIAAALKEVADQARDEGWHAPVIEDVVELASQRAFGLSVEVEY